MNGISLSRAEQQKRAKYGDATASGLCELLTLACEVGGRWNETATDLVYKLAVYKSQYVPLSLRRSVELAWVDRWASMLGIVVQDAIAASLLAVSGAQLVLDQSAAPIPELDAVLDGQRWAADDGIVAVDFSFE